MRHFYGIPEKDKALCGVKLEEARQETASGPCPVCLGGIKPAPTRPATEQEIRIMAAGLKL